MKLVARRVNNRRMLKLVRQWLAAGVMVGSEFNPNEQGVPQGSAISPLLANVALHELDRLWDGRCRGLGKLVRYADDWSFSARPKGKPVKGSGE